MSSKEKQMGKTDSNSAVFVVVRLCKNLIYFICMSICVCVCVCECVGPTVGMDKWFDSPLSPLG